MAAHSAESCPVPTASVMSSRTAMRSVLEVSRSLSIAAAFWLASAFRTLARAFATFFASFFRNFLTRGSPLHTGPEIRSRKLSSLASAASNVGKTKVATGRG